MDLQDIFICNMKRFRKLRHITQEQLAELCGTDTSYIGQIEIRRRFPSLPLVERIAAALKVEPYQLYKPQGPEEQLPGQKLQAELLAAICTDISRILSPYTGSPLPPGTGTGN